MAKARLARRALAAGRSRAKRTVVATYPPVTVGASAPLFGSVGLLLAGTPYMEVFQGVRGPSHRGCLCRLRHDRGWLLGGIHPVGDVAEGLDVTYLPGR